MLHVAVSREWFGSLWKVYWPKKSIHLVAKWQDCFFFDLCPQKTFRLFKMKTGCENEKKRNTSEEIPFFFSKKFLWKDLFQVVSHQENRFFHSTGKRSKCEWSDLPRNLRVPDFRNLGSRPRTSRRNSQRTCIKNSKWRPQNTKHAR